MLVTEELQDIWLKPSDLHLESLSSHSTYIFLTKQLGFTEIQFSALSENVSINYYRLLMKMKQMQEEIDNLFSPEFTLRMEQRLKNSVEAGEKGVINGERYIMRKHLDGE